MLQTVGTINGIDIERYSSIREMINDNIDAAMTDDDFHLHIHYKDGSFWDSYDGNATQPKKTGIEWATLSNPGTFQVFGNVPDDELDFLRETE